MTLKQLVKETAIFNHYRQGIFYYYTCGVQFPIPTEEIGMRPCSERKRAFSLCGGLNAIWPKSSLQKKLQKFLDSSFLNIDNNMMNKIVKNPNQARQGDVFIRKVAKLPPDAIFQKKGQVILAHGEATGHAHTIEGAPSWEKDGELYFETDGKTPIIHQEHNQIIISKGLNERILQTEYSPEEIRNVRD